VSLKPRQPAFLHHLDIHHLAEVVFQPFGYLKSAPIKVPALKKTAEGTSTSSPRWVSCPLRALGHGWLLSMTPWTLLSCYLPDSPQEQSLPSARRSVGEGESSAVSVQVTQAGENRGVSTVQLKHMVDRECGSHILRLSCALWVYNCTSVPLALQESATDEAQQESEVRCHMIVGYPIVDASMLLVHSFVKHGKVADAAHHGKGGSLRMPCMYAQATEDEVPKQWLPPYEGARRQPSPGKRPPPRANPKEGSSSSLQGLEQVLSSREGRHVLLLFFLALLD
jgi:hypothetical protein